MSILTQAFFPLVGSHLVSLSFFTAWHDVMFKKLLCFNRGFHLVNEGLCGFECRNVVSGDDDGGVSGDVPSCLLCSFLDDETSKTS